MRAALVLTVLSISSLSLLVATPEEASAYTIHAPILIDGDSNFTATNGVISGSGSPIDPYIIGGWEIDASTSDGIEVTNTGASFVIQDVLVRDGGPSISGFNGIHLKNVTAGAIADANITRNKYGIFIEYGTDVIIRNSNLTSNSRGVRSYPGSRISLQNVSARNNPEGAFDLVSSSSVRIVDCYVYSSGMSSTQLFSMGSDLLIERSTFVSGYSVGIYLYGATRAEIRNNVIRDYNLDGIKILGSSQVSIHDNFFTKNGHYAIAGLGGVSVYGSSSVNIFQNNFTGNYVGVGLYEYGYNKYVHVYHNQFYDNVKQAAQEYDSTSGYAWDNGYPSGGNYWDDYLGWDNYSGFYQNMEGSDGVGDTPYDIPDLAKDRFPLMEPGGTVNTPPVARFVFAPSSGYLTTEFEFNASASYDLEDPPEDLVARWDFEDDGTWDTSWTTTKTMTHTYSAIGVYVVRLAIRDTYGSVVQTTHSPTVFSMRPIALFSVTPQSGFINTVFDFDASASSDFETPASSLEVRWDWEDDGIWDTNWSALKTAEHQYLALGVRTVRLEVRDADGATNSTTRQVSVNDTAPVAAFTIDSAPPDHPALSIEVNASQSADLEEPIDLLWVRWDWEDDGVWDTGWSLNKIAQHQYAAPGTYTVRVEVRDTGGLVGNATQKVTLQSPDQGNPLISDIFATFTILAVATTVIIIVVIMTIFFVFWRKKAEAEGPSVDQTGKRTQRHRPPSKRSN